MKYRVTIEFDTESGDYEIQFNNLTDAEAGVDYHLATESIHKIFGDFEEKTNPQVDRFEIVREDN